MLSNDRFLARFQQKFQHFDQKPLFWPLKSQKIELWRLSFNFGDNFDPETSYNFLFTVKKNTRPKASIEALSKMLGALAKK